MNSIHLLSICSALVLGLAAQVPAPAPVGGKPGPASQPTNQVPTGVTQQPASRPGSTGSRSSDAKTADSKTQEPKTDEAKGEEIKLPASASPEDIRAVRGAQAMLEAEARLRELVKSGKIAGLDKILSFEEISSWPYQDGLKGMPKSVQELDGKKVLMTGFMLPIDEVENIKQFLLVQSLWSCCYGQPPDINGIVRVVMQGNKRTDYHFEPIKVIGTFRVKATIEDGYCVDIFQLHAESVEVIK